MFAQTDERAKSDPVSGPISGIALDVFPVLNGIFSDDSDSDIFTVNYLWGRNRFHHEIGISPRFRTTKSETDDPVLKTFGLEFRFFHGKTRTVAERWFVTLGLTYEYHYAKSVSEPQGNLPNFSFTTIEHTGGAGPQLLFGYRMADQVWMRSRIAGLLQYQASNTKIKDGSVEASDQNIDILNFNITPPTFLELVYIF